MSSRNTWNTSLTAIALSIVSASYVQAAGFAVNDQSATASGSALAGAAAMSDNISGSYWNPALLLNAKENSFYVSGALIIPKTDVTVNSVTGSGTSKTAAGDVVDNSFIPSLYFAHRLSNKTIAGVALNTPFGFSTDYDADWAGQLHGTKTRLVDSALSFSLAHQTNNRLSVGASVQYHSAEVELDSSVGAANNDFTGEINADATAFGYSLGLLFEPQVGTRLGVGYRSEVEFDFEGSVEYSAAALAALGGSNIVNADLSDNITLPSMFTFSAEQVLTPKMNVMATAIYTGWRSMDELRINFDDSQSDQSDSVLTFDFEDQWFYSVGGTYQYSDQLILRAGIAYDNSPVKDEFRSVRTPDGDRKWLSFGGTYDYSKSTSITASYTHVMIEDVTVDRDGTGEDAARGAFNADYESSANVISLAMNMEF